MFYKYIHRHIYIAVLIAGILSSVFAFQNCTSGFEANTLSNRVKTGEGTDRVPNGDESAVPSDPSQPKEAYADLSLSIKYRSDLDAMSQVNLGARPKVGIAYMVWHCLANNPARNKVISEAKVNGQWGVIPEFHWREVPAATNSIQTYSAADKNLVRKHFAMLEKAHIDFVVVDFTNQSNTPGGADEVAPQCMLDGFKNIIDVSVERGGKIKVIPWVSFKGNLHTYLLDMMGVMPLKTSNPYEKAIFYFQGKPLIIASWDVARRQNEVGAAIGAVERAGVVVKKMWALHSGALRDSSGTPVWSFMEQCRSGFLESQGNTECSHYNHPEMASVSVAYQETFITDFRTAVPKFNGRTFLKQLKTAQRSGAPMLVINTWNEWMAQRFCLKDNLPTHLCYANDGSPINEHFPFSGRPVFVDVYDREYSRDIEPDTTGSEYYELMRDGVAAVKGLSVEKRYSEFKEVTVTSGGVPGQNGHWWCDKISKKPVGPIWVCIGTNCSTDATMGQVIKCGTR